MKHVFAVVMAFLVVIDLLMPGPSVQAQSSMTPEETARNIPFEFNTMHLFAVTAVC